MKKQSSKKTIWQSVISVLVMGIFILFATGSFYLTSLLLNIPVRTTTTYIGNNTYEEETQVGTGEGTYFIIKTYQLDAYGNKHGTMTRESGFLTSNLGYVKETVNMSHGLRHGPANTTYGDGSTDSRYYLMGNRIDNIKAANITTVQTSTYQVISNKYPWYISSLNAFGFDNEYIESFTDTIESIMYRSDFEEDDFGEYFSNAIDSLKLTPYDSLINLYPVINYEYGLELMKKNELRIALIDFNRDLENSTYDIVKTTYPGYLTLIHETNDPDQEIDEFSKDFEGLCMLLDSLMLTYSKLDTADPFFTDSVDVRINRALGAVMDMEKSANALTGLKSALMVKDFNNTINPSRNSNSALNQLLINTSPDDLAQTVLFEMFVEYSKGNVLIYSALEAYYLSNNTPFPPTVTTEFDSGVSATSMIINGNVIEDGNSDIIERGIVWATVNNPTIDNQLIKSGTGLGSYNATIKGLTEESKYYARAYAINDAGTSYGNCISFIARSTVGIRDKEINDIDFNVFPNPASNEINLEFDINKSENIFVQVIDLQGNIVLQKQLNEVQIGKNQVKFNISGLENGLYICSVKNNQTQLFSQKLYVAH